MDDINCGAVIISAVAAFIFGGIWYSSSVFGKLWTKHSRVVPIKGTSKHSIYVHLIALIFYLISAYVFAHIIGPMPELEYAVKMGFITGLGFAATSFGINYAFSHRGITLFLIDGGYHTLQFVLYGIIFGLWH